MHQQLWEYKLEEKIHLKVRERKRFNINALDDFSIVHVQPNWIKFWNRAT
jgi:hypothetical protein